MRAFSPETEKMVNEQLRSLVQQISLSKIVVPKISLPQESLQTITVLGQLAQKMTEQFEPLFEQERKQVQAATENLLSAQSQSLGKISRVEEEDNG